MLLVLVKLNTRDHSFIMKDIFSLLAIPLRGKYSLYTYNGKSISKITPLYTNRTFMSMVDPNNQTSYKCKVEDGGDGPLVKLYIYTR